ncbi:MAG: hypothetical protein ACJ763_07050 [Bdellovibrionia bacterium]
MKARFFSIALAALVMSLTGMAQAKTQTVSLYRTVSEYSPAVVMETTQPVYVESIDVNWRGANGYSAINAQVLADGELVWSGLIPAYDPTFHTAIRARVTTIELRVSGGSAYVNWAKVYTANGKPSQAHGPDFIGDLDSAAELARELIYTLADIEPTLNPEQTRAHIIPLKTAAANVYSIAEASGSMRRIDVFNAVYALELEFRNQNDFYKSLIAVNGDFEAVLNLMTIRERYKALFGSTSYPETTGNSLN